MRCFAIGVAIALVAGGALAQPVGQVARAQDIDESVRPGDSFYRYANGQWLATTALPDGVPSYGSSIMLSGQNALRVRALLAAAAATPSDGVERKVGDYYAGWMDVSAIEALGLAPLAGDMARIAAIGDRTALSAWLGANMRLDDGTNSQTDGLFGVWIHQGFHDPDHYVPHLVQGGLGMDPDAYRDAGKVDGYRAHVAEVFRRARLDDAEARAGRVVGLEIAIAATHASAADTADVFKTDNAWRRGDFAAKAPGMDWAAWFAGAGLDRQADFVVWQPSAVVGTSALIASQPVEAWKDYLRYHLMAHYAGVLPKAFGGVEDDRGRQAVAATNAALGEGVGRLYVARWFSADDRAAAQAMVENIRTAYRSHIANAAWMSPQTRAKAMGKLETLKVGVGYPAAWSDYGPLVVVRGDAFGNMRRAEAFAYRQAVAKLSRPVDPAEWAVLPQSVGAILNFSPNSMQFAAGLLQPPYFDPKGDRAANYGSAGAGLSHEVSHSFDELGNIYDAQGRLGMWWTPDDVARFHAMQAPLIAQLSGACVQADLCVKGEQVASESTADLVGLMVAYDAYHLALNGKPDRVIDGLTGDQRFFLAFAQRWRRLQTDAALRQQVATDSHLPGEFRSDAVRNVDAWYEAFGVKPGDTLYLAPEKRVRLW